MHEDIIKAIEVLNAGGLILYPTDTVWGIGCDATNEDAVKKIYALKKREDSKALLVLMNNINRLSQYVEEVPEIAWKLLDVNDKPMTIIYPGAKNLAKNLIAEDGSVGIRITNDEFCDKLLTRFKKPIVSTSANISGQSSPATFEQITDEVKRGVAHITSWRQDDLLQRPASSIIKIDEAGRIEVLRK